MIKKVIDFNRLPKQEYIQPTVKEVEIKLTTILAGSIKNEGTGYTFGSNGNLDDEGEYGNGEDAL